MTGIEYLSLRTKKAAAKSQRSCTADLYVLGGLEIENAKLLLA